VLVTKLGEAAEKNSYLAVDLSWSIKEMCIQLMKSGDYKFAWFRSNSVLNIKKFCASPSNTDESSIALWFV